MLAYKAAHQGCIALPLEGLVFEKPGGVGMADTHPNPRLFRRQEDKAVKEKEMGMYGGKGALLRHNAAHLGKDFFGSRLFGQGGVKDPAAKRENLLVKIRLSRLCT